MSAQASSSDRSLMALQRFEERSRANVRSLVTNRVIAEHKRNPLGDHSDVLARVLNYLRRSPSTTPFVVICTEPFRDWRIAQLGSERGKAPTFVDEQTYHSEAKAMHALFLKRIEILNRE